MTKHYEPRRAKPGETITTTGADGKEITIQADDEGVVRPTNDAQARLADQRGLPVAQKAKQADKSAGDGGRE